MKISNAYCRLKSVVLKDSAAPFAGRPTMSSPSTVTRRWVDRTHTVPQQRIWLRPIVVSPNVQNASIQYVRRGRSPTTLRDDAACRANKRNMNETRERERERFRKKLRARERNSHSRWRTYRKQASKKYMYIGNDCVYFNATFLKNVFRAWMSATFWIRTIPIFVWVRVLKRRDLKVNISCAYEMSWNYVWVLYLWILFGSFFKEDSKTSVNFFLYLLSRACGPQIYSSLSTRNLPSLVAFFYYAYAMYFFFDGAHMDEITSKNLAKYTFPYSLESPIFLVILSVYTFVQQQ